jgi:lipopolysaccharide transport system permease protein
MQLADEPAAEVVHSSTVPADPTGPPRAEAGRAGGRPGGPTVRALLALNPMTGLIAAFRASVLGGPIPWAKLVGSSACALLSFLIGCIYFRRVEDSFADII